MRADVQKNGFQIEEDEARGRPSISAQQIEKVRAVVKDDKNSRLISHGHKVDGAISLTQPKSVIFRSLESGTVSMSSFYKYTDGTKNSAVPEIRKARNATDMCSACTDALNHKTYLTSKLTQLGDDNITKIVNKMIANSIKDLDYKPSREDNANLEMITKKLNEKMEGDTQTFLERFRSVLALGKHKFFAQEINDQYYDDMRSCDDTLIITNSDWKENATLGRGGDEDSTYVHDTSQCAVYGTVVKYIHPTLQKVAFLEIATFSRALDKTTLAAVKLEERVLQAALEVPSFKEAWDKAKEVVGYFDKGKHYDSEHFLYDRLIAWPKNYKKIYRLQFLEGSR